MELFADFAAFCFVSPFVVHQLQFLVIVGVTIAEHKGDTELHEFFEDYFPKTPFDLSNSNCFCSSVISNDSTNTVCHCHTYTCSSRWLGWAGLDGWRCLLASHRCFAVSFFHRCTATSSS